MQQPAQEIHNAIQAKDGAKFDSAFEKFTLACNSCHEAAGLGFIGTANIAAQQSGILAQVNFQHMWAD